MFTNLTDKLNKIFQIREAKSSRNKHLQSFSKMVILSKRNILLSHYLSCFQCNFKFCYTCLNEPKTRLNEPKTRSNELKTRLNEPKIRSNELKTRLNEPKTRLNEPKTRLNEPKTRLI